MKGTRKHLSNVLAVSILIAVLCFWNITNTTHSQPSKQTSEQTTEEKSEQTEKYSMKLILLGNSFWDEKAWGLGIGSELFERLGCKVKNCFLTDERKMLNESDAVLFHIHQLDETPLPRYNYQQRWIFFMLESPGWSINLNYMNWNGLFNWTMTYQLDSDVPMRNGLIQKKDDNTALGSSRGIIPGKQKLIAWMVSNCPTQSVRMHYVENLKKYVTVDIYGRCGTLSCKKEWTKQDTNCMDMISKTYKFYLAFENSICKDYVTEKFYKLLPYDVVPIVRGGVDYVNIIPRGQKWIINTADFKTIKDLAYYIKYLDQNPKEYAKYLENRFLYDFQTYFTINESPVWCHLCEKLHDSSEPAKIYNDIRHWWGKQHCKAPTDLL